MRIQAGPRPRRVVRRNRGCGSTFPWGRSPRCPPPTAEMLGQTPRLGPRDPVPNWHLVVPNWVSELLGQRTEKTLVQPHREEFWRLPGGGSGCPVSVWVPFEEVSEAPVPRLFQRLPTFDLESPVVNFKVQLGCGEEELSRAPRQPILRVF